MARLTLAHASIEVGNLERSLAFYIPLFELLKLKVNLEDGWAYFTSKEGFIFNISQAKKASDRSKNVHLAFSAQASKKLVDDFYNLAIASGAKSNGKPGIRKTYAADYYAAFVFDPDGHNIEVVARKK